MLLWGKGGGRCVEYARALPQLGPNPRGARALRPCGGVCPPRPIDGLQTPGEIITLRTMLSPPPTCNVFLNTLPFPTSAPGDPTSTASPAAPCPLTSPSLLPASVSSSSSSSYLLWFKPVRFSSTTLIWGFWRLLTASNNPKHSKRRCLSALRRSLLGVQFSPARAGPRSLSIHLLLHQSGRRHYSTFVLRFLPSASWQPAPRPSAHLSNPVHELNKHTVTLQIVRSDDLSYWSPTGAQLSDVMIASIKATIYCLRTRSD